MDHLRMINDTCPNALTGSSAHFFLTLINLLISSKCLINPIDEYPVDYSPLLRNNDEFDFIIIGGGSAGSVLANKLSENQNWNVLLLEAGDIPSSLSEMPSTMFSIQTTNEDWQYTIEPSDRACLGLKEHKCRWPRGKLLGGCSSINAMLYIRGKQHDYDQWANQGNPGWDYETIFEIYQQLENLQVEQFKTIDKKYGENGYQPLNLIESKQPLIEIIKKSAKQLGIPSTEIEENLGYFEALQTIENGVRANTGKVFLGRQMKNRKNLKVALKAHVEKLQFNNDQTRIDSILVNIDGKLLNLNVRNEVILSAGAINSPQLLMLSGIGPKEHLQQLQIPVIKDLSVGENLQDHSIFLGFYLKLSSKAVNYENPIDEVYKYFMYRQGTLGTISITNLVGFIDTKNQSNHKPNMQFHHILHVEKDQYLLPEIMKVMGVKDEIFKQYSNANQQSNTLFIIPTLLNPKSRGFIRLKSKNPYDSPLINPNYFNEQEDADVMIEAIEFLQKLINTTSFQQYQPELVDLNLENCRNFKFPTRDYWYCALKQLSTTLYHPVGTCKMGPKSDQHAVVDGRLKVYGIENLRIADASIMPKIISGNTHAPAMMIGMKAGKMIMEDWLLHDEL